MKLGAPNLGAAWAQPLDRALSQTSAPVMFRLRLESTARLLAEGLRTPLRNRPGAPVELINIGGGPSMDALNALLLLQKDQQGLLDDLESASTSRTATTPARSSEHARWTH